MKALAQLSAACEKFAIAASGILLAIVFALVFGAVIFRVVGSNFALSEELSRWGLVSICFIGASAALKQRQHVAVNMLMQILPLRIAKVCIAIAYVAVIILLGFSAFYSFKAAVAADGMMGDVVQISMMWVKLMLPLGMTMMLVHLLHGLSLVARGKDHHSILIGS